ncbi:MAG: hypothetical protein IPF92_14930 [Myxococcales bacterium]|jgi:hypothetical protein|nr:hypothetical protein [Myxococcales bacterium]MBL0195170.1 hypothetical protein [Myxococcales bacterium]HQY63819.1 hypothetical protein [Polyangiaceae bacterium]
MQKATQDIRYPLAPYRVGRARNVSLVALGLGGLACAALAGSGSRVLQALAAVLVVSAVALVARRLRRPAATGALIWRGGRLVRELDGVTSELLDLDEPFGLTVLGNRRRTRVLLAFTRLSATRFVSVHLDEGSDDTRAALVALAATIPEGDALDVDGADIGLHPADALALVRALERTHPLSLRSLYLSTSKGDPLVLAGHDIHLGAHSFDLRAPLEWRPFVFHESSGAITTLYQATWLRQRGDELVLVAPMPLDVIPRSGSALGGTPASELRILAQTSEAPPPRELRVAIDRMFMLPLRRALDAAPPAKRAPSIPPATHRKAARSSAGD